ncbi:abortive infection protein [Reticulibacter mediterranei]|uniref:Abortive infection protein n=1 Tax=Reticulibacter mediterranei TaxID=2778369 RepID=A0A8J3INZ4_9CHLR|nr:CPBP family glutamic-type intramembrane protease [Reticulibacter mediterranei]GHO97503.1 abortive infection protein [Reticulibacter mediterranei]
MHIQPSKRQNVNWDGVVWYLIGAFLISWLLLIGLYPFTSQAETISMFGPGLASVLVRLLRREGFADAGFCLFTLGTRWPWRWYVAAYGIPLVLLGSGMAASFLLGIQRWILPETVRQLHLSPPQLAGVLIALPIVIVGLVTITTFGEEVGWRGYLLLRLLPLGSIQATLLTGLLWGLWHIPTILLNNHGFGAAFPWVSIPAFTLVIMLYGIFLAWLRLGSGCIWPAALGHAVLNTCVSFLFASFSTQNRYLEAPLGLFTLVPFLLFALWLILTGGIRLPPKSQMQ